MKTVKLKPENKILGFPEECTSLIKKKSMSELRTHI